MREGSMDALRSLRAPMGLYSVMGNHDLMAGTGEQERTYLERMGIRFIVNESIPVSSSVWITGLDDERFGKRAMRRLQPKAVTSISLRNMNHTMFWKHHKRSMTFILPAILMEDNSFL